MKSKGNTFNYHISTTTSILSVIVSLTYFTSAFTVYVFQIVDLSLILKDNAPVKEINPDDEFAGDMWDSEEQQEKEAEEEDPFWK